MPKVLFADRSKRFAAALIALFLEFTRRSEALIRPPVALAGAYPKVFVCCGSRIGWRDGLYICVCVWWPGHYVIQRPARTHLFRRTQALQHCAYFAGEKDHAHDVVVGGLSRCGMPADLPLGVLQNKKPGEMRQAFGCGGRI